MDRVKDAQHKAAKEFVAEVGRALSGMLGDPDAVCDTFTTKYNRQTAQAVLQLIAQADTLKQQVAQEERRRMRIESGFQG